MASDERRPKERHKTDRQEETHWETSSSWYDKIVGTQGHYYHEHVILPQVQKWLKTGPQEQPHLLDLACGQGVLSHHLPKEMRYLGVDGSSSLVTLAKRHSKHPQHRFLVHDLTSPLSLPTRDFSHAAILLAAQNFIDPAPLFQNAFSHLRKEGLLILVLNHPCFRIPRQSSWGIDLSKKLQYRRIDLYMSSLKIPIQTHPGKREDQKQTLSFHHPLSYFTSQLTSSGFVITALEEWCSDKKSVGKQASMENRSRKEFPLFLAITCKK